MVNTGKHVSWKAGGKYLLCTNLIKCWGGTKARSMSTSATTIFLASFLNPSKAALAMATTYPKKKKAKPYRGEEAKQFQTKLKLNREGTTTTEESKQV